MKNREISELHCCAFDFETTGLTPGRDSIIEVGAVIFQDRAVLREFSELVDPGVPLLPEITRLTGITSSMLHGRRIISQVLPDFEDLYAPTIMIAHNAPFDAGFLQAALLKNNRPAFRNPLVDTQKLAKKAFPGLKSYSLGALAEHLGIPTGNAHRALDDARTCMRIFWHCVDNLSLLGSMTLEELRQLG